MPSIKYIKNKDIDFALWDTCISQAHNGDVFGYSWYLDSVCSFWDAIIIDNYKAVFPVPISQIAGIKGMLTTKLLNKLNVYASKNISSEIISELFSCLPRKFYNFYTENKKLNDNKSKVSEKISYRLDLIKSYEAFQKTYSEFYKEQLETARQNKVFYNTGILPVGLVLLATVTDNIKKKEQNSLKLLSSLFLRKNKGEIFGAFNDKNRLIAAVLFIRSHYKINIIAAYQTKEAKKKKALYGLIDHYIKTHSEQAVTLDFFGLNLLPDDFYKGLGAKEYPYYNIKKRIFF